MKRGREVDEALAKVERAETELVKARAELAEVLLALERPAAATTPETATASRDMELVELIDITDSESDEPGPSTPAASYLHEIHVLKQVLEPCPSPVANVAFARGACRAPRPFPPRREPGAPAIKREAGAPAIKREHEACAAPPAAPQAEPGAPAIKREAGAPAINCKPEAPPAAATAAERPPHSAPSARPVFVKREPEAPHAARPSSSSASRRRRPRARARPGHASSSLLRPPPRRGCRAGGGSDNGHRARRTRALSGPAVSDSIEPPPPGPLDIVGMVPIEIDLDMDPILACPRGPMVPAASVEPLGGSFSQPSAALAVPAAPALMFTHALELPTEALQRVGPQRPAHALPPSPSPAVYGRHARWERFGLMRSDAEGPGANPSGPPPSPSASTTTTSFSSAHSGAANGLPGALVGVVGEPGPPGAPPRPAGRLHPDPTAEGRWIYCTFAASGTSLLALFMPSAELLNVQPPEGAGPTPDCTLAQLDLAGPPRMDPPPASSPAEETRLAQLVAVTFEDRLVLARLRPLPAGPVPMALQIVHAAPLPRGYTRFEASALSADAGALFVLATRSRKGQSLLVFDL
eukprot:tig00020753_g13684.t1